jgi:hypothetical protein
MYEQNKQEQVMLWRAAVIVLGRALRHEYETKHEQMPEHMRRLVTQLETAGEPEGRGAERLSERAIWRTWRGGS